jgi:hypothetical protein
MDRRTFLQGIVGGVAGLTLHPRLLAAASDSGRFIPEYAGSMDEILFVYDQCSAPHLLREMVEILRNAPAEALIRVLVSQELAATARVRLAEFGLEQAELVVSEEKDVSGDWGRDIFQLGIDNEGSKLLGVPWFKAARTRSDLDRGWRQLKALAREDLAVRLIPAAFEGGNLMSDVLDTRNVLFAGSTIAVETRELYKYYYGSDPGDDGVARILAEGLGADSVIWLGPRQAGQLARQSRFGFHIDMGMTLVAPGVAVAARCDPSRLGDEDHRALLEKEAARTLKALARREAAGMPWPDDLDLPRDEASRAQFIEAAVRRERSGIEAVASEWENTAEKISNLGYTIHRLETDPRRVRRFQSHTNAIVTTDRLLMPLFPFREHIHGWLLQGDSGRDRVDVELGLADSEFGLKGDNLAAFQLYQSLHPGVRAVRDYFYLASGNVHWVIGRGIGRMS